MKKLLEVVKNFDQEAFNAYMIANNISLKQVLDLCIFAESERDSMRQELSSMLEVVSYDSECNYVEFAASRYDIEQKQAEISLIDNVIDYADQYYAVNF